MNIIDIQDITKDYGGGRGVFDIAFQVKRGEVLGFLGPNGAGKTTLMKMIATLLFPTEGAITFEGKEIQKLDEKYREKAGVLIK